MIGLTETDCKYGSADAALTLLTEYLDLHYFPPGPRLPSHHYLITPLKFMWQFQYVYLAFNFWNFSRILTKQYDPCIIRCHNAAVVKTALRVLPVCLSACPARGPNSKTERRKKTKLMWAFARAGEIAVNLKGQRSELALRNCKRTPA